MDKYMIKNGKKPSLIRVTEAPNPNYLEILLDVNVQPLLRLKRILLLIPVFLIRGVHPTIIATVIARITITGRKRMYAMRMEIITTMKEIIVTMKMMMTKKMIKKRRITLPPLYLRPQEQRNPSYSRIIKNPIILMSLLFFQQDQLNKYILGLFVGWG